MLDINYDDRNLQQLFTELTPKRRLQALRGGFRKEANRVRKTAVNNLRSSIRSDRDLEKGVRSLVFKRKAGFRITVGTKRANKKGKGEAGFHTNRQGLKKPILIWAEDGTKARKTKGCGGKHGARSTGRMKRYGFMDRTLKAVRGSVTENIHDMVAENVQKVAKKYGCK